MILFGICCFLAALAFGPGPSGFAQETELDVLKDIRTSIENSETSLSALPSDIDSVTVDQSTFLRDQFQQLYYGLVYLAAVQFLLLLLFIAVFVVGRSSGASGYLS